MILFLGFAGCSSDIDFIADHIIVEATSAYVIEEVSETWIVKEVIYGDEVVVGQRAHCSVLPNPERKRLVFILLFSERESGSLIPLQSEFPLDADGELKRYEVTPSQIADRIVRLKADFRK